MQTILGRPVIALTILGLAAVSGCLISGTEVFTYVVGDIQITANAFEETSVDLTTNSTYQDHREDIRLIDRVGFTCDAVNPTANPVNISAYFSTTAGLGDPATQATPLFLNFAVPANSTHHIDYDESLAILLNFEELQAAVDSGQFTLYSTGPANMSLDDLTLVVTFTVGL